MVRTPRPLTLLALILASTPLTNFPAAAAALRGFDVKGFTQGMHKNDAHAVAERQGYEVHDTVSGTIISKGGQADRALFCRDELVSYAYGMRGGFMQFLREIKSFEGQGYRRTNLDLGTQMQPDGKEGGHLTIYMFRPEDYYYVTISMLGTEDDDTGRLALQYEALDKEAKCRR